MIYITNDDEKIKYSMYKEGKSRIFLILGTFFFYTLNSYLKNGKYYELVNSKQSYEYKRILIDYHKTILLYEKVHEYSKAAVEKLNAFKISDVLNINNYNTNLLHVFQLIKIDIF